MRMGPIGDAWLRLVFCPTMEDLTVNERITIPAAELEIAFARAGGPGGQHVNKVESKVEIRWRPAESAVLSAEDLTRLLERLGGRLTSAGELIVTSRRTRDQVRNREDAREKLAALIRESLKRPKRRRKTRPSRQSVEKRLQQKKERSRAKQGRRETPKDE